MVNNCLFSFVYSLRLLKKIIMLETWSPRKMNHKFRVTEFSLPMCGYSICHLSRVPAFPLVVSTMKSHMLSSKNTSLIGNLFSCRSSVTKDFCFWLHLLVLYMWISAWCPEVEQLHLRSVHLRSQESQEIGSAQRLQH